MLLQTIFAKWIFDTPSETTDYLFGGVYFFGFLAAATGWILAPVVLFLAGLSIATIHKSNNALHGVMVAIAGVVMTLFPATLIYLIWKHYGLL